MAVSTEPASTGAVSMRELLEAGVHFGHQTRRWNPKMRRFIFAERGGIYIIDLTQTAERLDEARQFVRNVAERGGTVLFVGTKKQAQDAVENEAKRVGMPYVNHRWLGGLLTNWRTMSDRIDRLHELRSLRDEGQMELLPAKERISMAGELEKLEANLGGVADMRRQPDAVVHRRPQEGSARRARGAPARAAGRRARRHELRPGRGRLRHPRQRRRDPVVQPRSCTSLADAGHAGKQKVSAQELQQPAAAGARRRRRAPRGNVERSRAGEPIEPVTEGETVPVPTGEAPGSKEGAEADEAAPRPDARRPHACDRGAAA